MNVNTQQRVHCQGETFLADVRQVTCGAVFHANAMCHNYCRDIEAEHHKTCSFILDFIPVSWAQSYEKADSLIWVLYIVD